MELSFAGGLGKLNVDLLFAGLPRIPNEGEELFSEGFSMQLGGGLPATMITLSRLNVPTKTATFLGKDSFSAFAKEKLSAYKSDAKNLYEGNGIPLNISALMITPADRSIISYTDEFEITDKILDDAYNVLKGAKIVQMQYPYLPLYERLKKDGCLLVLDTGWEDDLSIEKYKDYLRLADYYTPNVKEALKITGTTSVSEADKVLRKYFDRVIIKLDKDGCFLSENGETATIKVIPEFKKVDSTGAGDAFLSGLMYGIIKGYTFKESVLFGNITGGKCVTGIGCLSAYCDEGELLSLFEKYQDFLQ